MSAAMTTEIPPLWLRRPEDVKAHLEFASEHVRACILSIGGYQVFGWMAFDGGDVIQFTVHEKLAGHVTSPREGQPIEVCYESRSDRYQFLSSVHSVMGPMHWSIQIPGTIERRDKRADRRISVLALDGFSFDIENADGTSSSRRLRDVSAGGFGFVFDPNKESYNHGQLVTGTLHVQELGALVVQVEIRHTIPMRQANRHVCGTRIARIGYSDRIDLAKFCAAWQEN